MKRTLALLIVSLVVFCFLPTCCFAAESQGYLFAAEMIPPSNQIGNMGYYHIPGTPGEQIALQAKVTNQTDRSLEIKVVPMNAYSARDGIFYQSPLEITSQTFALVDEQYGVAQYIAETSPVTLQPNQTQIVSFSVTVPELSAGTLLGSIRFVVFAGTQEYQQAQDQSNSAQMLIDRYQAIDTAIQIDLPQTTQSSMAVGDATFNGDQIGISVGITNQAAMIQENIAGTYKILNRENNVLFSGEMQTFKMAPMTAFQYPLSWQSTTLESGTYTLSLTLSVDGQETDYERTFMVNQAGITKAQQAQAKVTTSIQPSYPAWSIVVVELLVLVLITLFIRHLRMQHLANKKQ